MENWRNIPPLKRILDSQTLGEKCTVSVLQPFTFDNFQSEHPVCYFWKVKKMITFKNKWFYYFLKGSSVMIFLRWVTLTLLWVLVNFSQGSITKWMLCLTTEQLEAISYRKRKHAKMFFFLKFNYRSMTWQKITHCQFFTFWKVSKKGNLTYC